MPFAAVLLIAVCAGISALVTGFVLRRAEGLGLIQAPNARSSHTRPTPSGGGLGIVAAGALITGILAVGRPVTFFGILAASLLIAAMGWQDDRQPMPPVQRLIGQAIALMLAITLAVPPAGLALQFPALPWWLLTPVALVAGVYWINLFNFMDGIDGLAGVEALFLFIAAAILLVSFGDDSTAIFWCIGLGAAVLGFLVFNWPPARIFMGDVGSTYLGFVLAILALVSIARGDLSLWTWMILTATFVADATVTMLRRLSLGENVLSAHRRHAYQRLSRLWGGHKPVTLLFLGIDVVALLPLAAFAESRPELAPWLALGTWAVLGAVAFWAGAGRPEHA